MEPHELTKRNASWRDELSQAVTCPNELCRLLELPDAAFLSPDYPLLVPRRFVDLMEKGNPSDPLLLQVLPRQEETFSVEGFSSDPVGEWGSISSCAASYRSPNRQILKKYPGRALILATETCGIHCRFCFRRHLPKFVFSKSFEINDSEKFFAPIFQDSSIEEVILSGGDPLMLADSNLGKLLHYIVKIPHVKRIRIHSRLPVVLPSRITNELAEVLSLSKPVYLVLHINHPNELGDDFFDRRRLLTSPVVLSQTVLLKGINDNIESLVELFDKLVDHRILPYYLHQLDRVHGAAHFEVPTEEGKRLFTELRNRLSGYAVPRYVRELVGVSGKQPIE